MNPDINYQERMQALLEKAQTDVVALVPGANMVYFTGLHFHLMERPTIALISEEGLSFIIPQLEVPKLTKRPDLEARAFAWRDDEGYTTGFEQSIAEMGLSGKSIGVDGMTMRVFELLEFQKNNVATDAVDLGQICLGLRGIKSDEEVALMQKAVNISEQALQNVLDWVQVGMTEQAIATRLTSEMNNLGAEGVSFEPLVLMGDKSALPHGTSSDRQLQEDDVLLIDFGCMVGGYPSDITRTFFFGNATDEMKKIYDAVYRANEAARNIAKPGVLCSEVDRAARSVIEAAGYGEYFIHRTGHGLGLDVHELPQISGDNDTPLEVGMVFTIEPGIYVQGLCGVRIEDNVVVTEDGLNVLTSFRREM